MRGSFSLKLRARSRQLYLKRDSGTGVVNFTTFLRATFFGNTSGRLLPNICNGHLFVILKTESNDRCSETRVVLVWCMSFFNNHFLRSVLL